MGWYLVGDLRHCPSASYPSRRAQGTRNSHSLATSGLRHSQQGVAGHHLLPMLLSKPRAVQEGNPRSKWPVPQHSLGLLAQPGRRGKSYNRIKINLNYSLPGSGSRFWVFHAWVLFLITNSGWRDISCQQGRTTPFFFQLSCKSN